MEWFSDWWNTLTTAEQVLYCIAIPSTLILLIQTILMLIGIGNGGGGDINPSDTSGLDMPDSIDGADLDAGGADLSDSGNIAPANMADFRLLSVQSVIAFLCIFGWSGIAALSCGMPVWGAILLALALGLAAMFLVAKIIQWSSKLAQNGTFDMKNLLGEIGSVYVPIPPKGQGSGKINISCGERFMEFDAVSDESDFIKTGTPVRVVDIISGSVLVVERE